MHLLTQHLNNHSNTNNLIERKVLRNTRILLRGQSFLEQKMRVNKQKAKAAMVEGRVR